MRVNCKIIGQRESPRHCFCGGGVSYLLRQPSSRSPRGLTKHLHYAVPFTFHYDDCVYYVYYNFYPSYKQSAMRINKWLLFLFRKHPFSLREQLYSCYNIARKTNLEKLSNRVVTNRKDLSSWRWLWLVLKMYW